MEIYREVPKFSQKTGKPAGTRKQWFETRCDVTGEVVRSTEDENSECYGMIGLVYGYSDPCFGSSGAEFELSEKGVDMYDFLQQPYVFASESGQYKSKVMATLLKAIKENACIDGALRALRTATALRLIEEGVVDGKQFSEEQ